MIVYFLEHIHYSSNGDFSDQKNLGVFSSFELACLSQERFSKLPGFKDAKDGFECHKISLRGGEKIRKNNVYILQSWDFFPNKNHEKISLIGIFSTKKSALLIKKEYKQNLIKNFYLSKYCLDEDNVFWNEGYISEIEAIF